MIPADIYAQRLGWRVVPLHDVASGVCSCAKGKDCRSSGKHPRIKDWTTAATADAAQVHQWWERWPDANIGIATGAASGFWVLDIDPDNGGKETLAALEAEYGILPLTVEAQTGSEGSHFLFKLPNFTIGNTAGIIAKGIDTRGEGGQIVVAPSVSGKGPYAWVNSPTNTEIVDAPEWILAKLRSPSRLAEAKPLILERGVFPEATPEVLDQARASLDAHGPAIEGRGGDTHTVHAAAILTHDFALSEPEAWPLFLEWNATCQPPWDEDDLRTKFENGAKYGKAEYGCRRSLDSVETALKLLGSWDKIRAHLWPILNQIRTLPLDDRAKQQLIEQEVNELTGIKPGALGLRVTVHPFVESKPGEIRVTTQLHEVADESLKAIAPRVFQRNGVLCEIVKAERTFIHDLDGSSCQDLMSRSARYSRMDEKSGVVAQAAPERVASILVSRRIHPEVRVLEAITTAPVFLADGSILAERGYNEQARVFLEPSVTVNVPSFPELNDAEQAINLFRDLLQDFKFASPADFSAWIAGLLSPLVKSAIGNAPIPLFCVSASAPAAGKTLLTDLVARIVTGVSAEVRPYNPKDPGEWGKRLTAFVRAAAPVSVFDNCNGPIGDEGLDRLITSSTWSDRILGASDAPPLPNVTTWWATGNNIEPVGDTSRRVEMIRLDVEVERPQERTGFKHVLPLYATEHRSELLSAALTLLRAYHVADRPPQKLPAWGSFEAWSDLVRGALVWVGLDDPFLTQQRLASDLNEPENEAHDFWITVVLESDNTSGGIVVTANSRGAREVLGLREEVTTHFLKRLLGRFIDKPRDGRRIRRGRDLKRNQVTYYVETII